MELTFHIWGKVYINSPVLYEKKKKIRAGVAPSPDGLDSKGKDSVKSSEDGESLQEG